MLTKKLFFLMLIGLAMNSCTNEDLVPLERPIVDDSEVVETRAPATHCETVIIDAITGEQAGTAKLIRTDSKVSMNCKINGLTPGYAYTIWWVIWNNPEFCGNPNQCMEPDFGNADAVQVEVMYAAGHVIGNTGKGNFGGSLNENDDSGSINDLFGLPGYGGLLDARAAEVHLVLRNHGPSIPGQVNEQINSYLGGCTSCSLCDIFFPDFTENPDEEGECADTMFGIFAPDCGQ